MTDIKKPTILVIDGDRDGRMALERSLSSLHHKAELAAGVSDALERLLSKRFDLLFLACDQGGAGDLEILDRITAAHPDTAVIVTYPDLSAADAARAIEQGAFDCISSPPDMRTLELAVSRALKSREMRRAREKHLNDLTDVERFYRDILENVRSGIWVTDHYDRVTYFNRAMEELSCVRRESVLGKNFFERFSTTLARAPSLADYYSRAKTFLELVPYDGVYIAHGDGRLSIQSGVMFPLKSEEGEFAGMVVTVEDITERSKAEERIRRLNYLMESLLAPRPLHEKLRLVTDGAVRIFDAALARIWLTKKGDMCDSGCVHSNVTSGPHVCRYRDKCLHLITSSGLYTHIDGETHRRVPFGCYKIGRVAAGQDPKFITNDATHDPRVHDHEWAGSHGLVSFAGYRLLSAEGTSIGVLALFSKHPLSSDEDSLLETVANATSHTIQTATVKQNLQESENRFQDITINTGDWIWETDGEGRYTYSNHIVQDVLGYSPDEIIGRYFYEFFHPAIRENVKAKAYAIFEKKKAFVNFINKNVHKDGHAVILETSGVPIIDESGALRGYRGVDRDVTERVNAEEALRQSQYMLKLVMDNTPGFIFWKDRNSVYLGCNKNFARVAGVASPEEIVGKTDYDLAWKEEEAEFFREVDSRVMRTGKPAYHIIEPQLQADGRQAWLDTNKIPLRNAEGKIIGILGTYEDITDRKKAEEELALSKQWYQTVFDAANDAIFIHDPMTGAILDANEKMCDMFGYTKDGARNCTIGSISKGEYPYSEEEALKWVKKAYSSGPQIFEWVARHKDGHLFPVEVNLKRALIGGEESVLAIVRDITRRKRLEKELIQAEKMAGIGQLAAGIAHEFNNFLAMISGYAQLAKAGTLEDKERAIDVAEKVAERAKVVVKNLVSFAREDKPEKRPTEIAETVEEALAPLSTQIKRQGISLKRHYSPVPRVLCDPGQIRQVLFNTILNAVQAMPEGGDLVISLESDDGQIVIRVKDSGCGIPEEIKERIFDPFVTTKGAISGGDVSGTGLGLSVSYGLIKEHGGDITAANNEDGGATFTIRLPALAGTTPADAATRDVAGERDASPPQRDERIMVIDDEEIILDLITEIMRKLGKHVTAIRNPQLALPILKREKYDIVFLDLVMPGHAGGLSLFREIKNVAQDAKIVLLTGKEIDEEIREALEEGACDFISKPFSIDEIRITIEAALSKRQAG